MGKHLLHIITGTTAVGKTAFAVKWAETHGAEIVSCDSLLVYRGLDVGTAKPSTEERAAVPHHCIDVSEPDSAYSVSAYVRDATAVIHNILARGKKIAVVGGSGFYLRAFYRAVTDSIAVPAAVEQRVRELQTQGLPALQSALLPFAPDRPSFLDWKNPRRVAKALERCLASGRPLAEIHARFREAPGPFDAFGRHTVLLTREPPALAARIKARARTMLANGLVEEVRRLRDTGKLVPGTPAASAVGYRETLDWLAHGGGNHNTLLEAITLSTRQLAARQRKWFRTQIRADEILCL
jgi:tRNA dimethylallyltransferase